MQASRPIHQVRSAHQNGLNRTACRLTLEQRSIVKSRWPDYVFVVSGLMIASVICFGFMFPDEVEAWQRRVFPTLGMCWLVWLAMRLSVKR